ncbi:MAG: hypothetical protein KGQ60_07895 [Planctomycetes bacterium]|nr:hypothetical protein [Planctomycetota bacterium]
MNSLIVLYVTATAITLVAVFCTWLCLVWSIPTCRRRLVAPGVRKDVPKVEIGGLTGWSSRVGSGIVSAGIAACAAIAWYGSYSVLAALIAASR